MEQTQNYQLNLWEGEDRILREDFNADNMKTEQALADLAEQAALIANCGNCKIVYGSYTGTGTYGSANPNTLTFNHKPVLVFVQQQAYIPTSSDYRLRLIRDVPYAIGVEDNSHYYQYVTWSNTGVEWYSGSAPDGERQFNKLNAVYCYVAFLAADE